MLRYQCRVTPYVASATEKAEVTSYQTVSRHGRDSCNRPTEVSLQSQDES
ncbi:hypothetical protein M3J09_001925 [Ascochyta lentis]